MRVHIHSDCYWFGGSEHAIALIINGIEPARDGVEVSFSYRSHPQYERGLKRIVAATNLHHGLDLREPGDTENRLARWTLRNKYLVWAADVLVLYRLLRRTKPDVVHVNNGGWPGAVSCHAAALAARLAGVPKVLYFVNNLAQPYDSLSRRAERPLDRIVVRCVSRFATASTAAGERLTQVLSVDSRRHVVLPNSVLLPDRLPSRDHARSRLDIDPGTSIIAAIGRLEERKGHRVLVEAAQILEKRLDLPWRIIIAGEGPERRRLDEQIARLGVGHRVTMLGGVDEPWDVIAAADVVALPSVANEDLPIVVLEAMAAARPVVASRVAGTPEQVMDGESGRLLHPGDAAALADALEDLVRDKSRCSRLGSMGRRRFEERFGPPVLVQRYLDVYRQLYGEGNR